MIPRWLASLFTVPEPRPLRPEELRAIAAWRAQRAPPAASYAWEQDGDAQVSMAVSLGGDR